MRTHIKLNRQNLRENYSAISHQTGKKILAVVKANAYGLGIKEVVKELGSFNCPGYVVGSLEEALAIRKSLIFAPILLLEKTADIRQIVSLKLTVAVHDLAQLEELARVNIPLRIQLNFDLGMKRDGFSPEELPEIKKILGRSRLVLSGVYGHHTGEKKYVAEADIFKKIATDFDSKILIHHQASSGLSHPDDFSNAVRVGGAIYGLAAVPGIDLKPVLFVSAPIWSVKRIEKQSSAGYEGGKPAPDDGFIYTIPLGYSDGFNRGQKIVGWLGGELLVQVGNMMMNHTLLFSKKRFDCGQEVEIVGDHLDIFNLAKAYKTIPYDLASSLSPTLRRIVA